MRWIPSWDFMAAAGLDARFGLTPIGFALGAVPADAPRWGKAYKNWLARRFSRSMIVACHATSLPVETNSISLDPDLKDAWGLPALCMTYKDHPDDLKTVQYLAGPRAGARGRSHGDQGLGAARSGTVVRRASAGNLPHGERPENLGGERQPPHARCAQPLPLRRKQLCDLRARTAHHDDSGPRLSRRGPDRRRRAPRRGVNSD